MATSRSVAKRKTNDPLKVVYISSPMKVKTSASNFRSLVQQLTGKNSDISQYMDSNAAPSETFHDFDASIDSSSPQTYSYSAPPMPIGTGMMMMPPAKAAAFAPEMKDQLDPHTFYPQSPYDATRGSYLSY